MVTELERTHKKVDTVNNLSSKGFVTLRFKVSIVSLFLLGVMASATLVMVKRSYTPQPFTPTFRTLSDRNLTNGASDTAGGAGANTPTGEIISAFRPGVGTVDADVHNDGFSYRWKEGEKYTYKFSFRVGDEQRSTYDIAGNCYLTIGAEEKLGDDQSGTGTGFAIAPGYLATCAHVVEHAAQVRGVFGEQRFTARVVDIDKDRDLAILSIVEDIELQPLQLGNSESLELAESVLVIGFPMTDVLGSGIKVSAGIVSGIDQSQGGRAIAIDGAINPGNSGGPVLTYSGEVVGLASATLQGDRINPVGFASSIDGLKELMEKNDIPVRQSDGGELLGAKDIMKGVAPSVCLIEISGRADNLSHKITTSVSYTRGRRSPEQMLSTILDRSQRGPMNVSRLGDIRGTGSTNQLPYVFASVPELLIGRFDAFAHDKWSVSQSYRLQRPRRTPFPGFSMRSRLHEQLLGIGPSEPDSAPEIEAELVTQYEVLNSEEDVLRIRKIRDLQTHHDEGSPSLDVSGEGVWEFDSVAGVPLSLEENLTVVRHENGQRIESPLTIKFTRIKNPPSSRSIPLLSNRNTNLPSSGQNTTQRMSTRTGSDGIKRKTHEISVYGFKWRSVTPLEWDAPELAGEPANAAEISEALDGIRDVSTRASSLANLAELGANADKRIEVLSLLRNVVAGSDPSLHAAAWRAYRNWMNADCASELRRVMDRSSTHRKEARDALFTLKLKEDVPLMLANIEALTALQVEQLKKYGSSIEPAVLDAVESTRDQNVLIRLLGVQFQVGTDGGIDRLTKFKDAMEPSLARVVESMVTAFKLRAK